MCTLFVCLFVCGLLFVFRKLASFNDGSCSRKQNTHTLTYTKMKNYNKHPKYSVPINCRSIILLFLHLFWEMGKLTGKVNHDMHSALYTYYTNRWLGLWIVYLFFGIFSACILMTPQPFQQKYQAENIFYLLFL